MENSKIETYSIKFISKHGNNYFRVTKGSSNKKDVKTVKQYALNTITTFKNSHKQLENTSMFDWVRTKQTINANESYIDELKKLPNQLEVCLQQII